MQDFLGNGWWFPILPTPGGRLRWVGGDQIVRQSIWMILGTAQGERLMLPEFGCGIHDLVFEPNTVTLRAELATEVTQALARWEPRIDVLDVQVTTRPQERNHLDIRIDYEIRALNSVDNLVYPFYLSEGRA